MRIALMVEYDGSHFHGWQAQTGLRTVQGVLESALTRLADHTVNVVCAGRTDTGVHATNQVVHFDTSAVRTLRAWVHGANSYLPKDVCVRVCKEMPDNFHARHSALARRYRYFIYNTPVRPALQHNLATWQYRQLDHRLMHTAGQFIVGEHDFTSFRSVECQAKTPMREIKQLTVTRQGDLVIVDITANAFLHHMVRNVVGVLMAIGIGRQPVSWIEQVLAAKDRRLGAETAPAYGLYLVSVTYPTEFGIIAALDHPHIGTFP